MIEVRNLTVRFGDKTVLDGLSAMLPDEGVVLVSAPSGRGKTTLLRAMAGLIRPDAGSVSGLSERRIGFVFQQDRLLPWKTALENVALVSDPALAERFLMALGLSEALHKYPAELSGGMARRCAIARALAYTDDVLFLDEPFTGLDEAAKAEAAQLITQRARLTVLVTHEESDQERFPLAARIDL